MLYTSEFYICFLCICYFTLVCFLQFLYFIYTLYIRGFNVLYEVEGGSIRKKKEEKKRCDPQSNS